MKATMVKSIFAGVMAVLCMSTAGVTIKAAGLQDSGEYVDGTKPSTSTASTGSTTYYIDNDLYAMWLLNSQPVPNVSTNTNAVDYNRFVLKVYPEGYRIFNTYTNTFAYGLCKIGENYYFAGVNGYMVYNKWIRIGQDMYFFGSNGQAFKDGLFKIDNSFYIFDREGRLYFNRIVNHNEYTYYVGNNGSIERNVWQQDVEGKMFFGPNGYMFKDGIFRIDGEVYIFNKDGYMQTGLIKRNGYLYYAASNGMLRTGRINVDGVEYYFSEENYAAVR